MLHRDSIVTAVAAILLIATPAIGQHAGKDLASATPEYPEEYRHVDEVSALLDRAKDAVDAELQRSPNTGPLTLGLTAAPDAYLVSTQLSQSWDAQSGAWQNENLSTYTRNDNGAATELLIQEWDFTGADWANSSRRVYTIGEDGYITETLDEDWDPDAGGGQGDWEPLQRRSSTFNEQGQVLVSMTELWDSDAGDYMLWRRTTSTYDDSGTQLQTYVSESSSFGPLAPSLRYTYTYHGDGNTASRLHERYDRDAELFENAGLTEYSYDSNGERVLALEHDWDDAAGDWVEDYRTMTEFSPNSTNPTSEVETQQRWSDEIADWENVRREVKTIEGDKETVTDQDWDSNANNGQGDWVNQDQSISTISDGVPVDRVDQEWDANQQAWVNADRRTIEIDDRGLPVSQLDEVWDGAAWVNSELLTMTYEEFETPTAVDSDLPAGGYELESSFPNPFTVATTISFTLPEPTDVRLEVFDMLGRRVETLVETTLSAGTHRVRMDADDLPGGLYMYRLVSERFRASRSMLLTR